MIRHVGGRSIVLSKIRCAGGMKPGPHDLLTMAKSLDLPYRAADGLFCLIFGSTVDQGHSAGIGPVSR